MHRFEGVDQRRLKIQHLEADLVVVGGGLAGTCAAITAAREGLKVVLVQDRPVLGGNASSEVRLWILGATSHMGNNNRWAREGGVIDEILVENMYRNREGNPVILDTILLEKAVAETNLTLLLNTAVYEVMKSPGEQREGHQAQGDQIESVLGFCSQNSTQYRLSAPLFCDASGDGVLGFLAGAAFRIGAESREEFDEGFAPTHEYGELLGHSMYFYTRDTGRPVKFVAPAYALNDIRKIPRWRQFSARDNGCSLWWIEYGGLLDTVHDTETIKWELWKVVYGVWNHIKNSGQFPEAANLTLEWVSTIPGKRESRRFEGDYMISQRDVIEQRKHADAVSFGGWAIDLHPAQGVYSPLAPCTQWHSKGVYQIPYRCMYSRNIDNLFLAGRIISATHVAFGSTRVMATCGHGGQAVGMAAILCIQHGERPRDILRGDRMADLQRRLARVGQFIPDLTIEDPDDLVASAHVTASSELQLDELAPSDEFVDLDRPRAMLLPMACGEVPLIRFDALAQDPTELTLELRTCSRIGHFTPDTLLETITLSVDEEEVDDAVKAGAALHAMEVGVAAPPKAIAPPIMRSVRRPSAATIEARFSTRLPRDGYVQVTLLANSGVKLRLSDTRLTGVLALSHRVNGAVSKNAVQTPPENSGIDSFPFWLPERRPGGKNLAMSFEPAIRTFGVDHLTRWPNRPTETSNAWIASFDDATPWIELSWEQPQPVGRLVLFADSDYDHPMESVLMGHPENEMPFCVPSGRVTDASGTVLASFENQHQSRIELRLDGTPRSTLRIVLDRRLPTVPVSLFRVQAFV
jgi:FAD dependent oxidoreductase